MNKNQPPAPPQTITIGSAEGNTIRLNENGISRQHAKISIDTNGSYLLEDLDSKNGTFVNGNEIKRRKVTLEDKVTFGNHEYLLKDLLIQAKVIEKPKDPLDFTEEFAGLKVVYEEHSRFLKKRDREKEKIATRKTNLRIAFGLIGLVVGIASEVIKFFKTGNFDSLNSIGKVTLIGGVGSLIGEIVLKVDERPKKEFESKWKCPKCGDDTNWLGESWAKMAAQKKCKKCSAIWVK